MRYVPSRSLRIESLEQRHMLSVAPVIGKLVPRSSIEGATSTFTFAFSDADAIDSHAAAVDWGDGSAYTHLEEVNSPFSVKHEYANAGKYQPRIWVTDSTNRTDIETFTMKVYPRPVRKFFVPVIQEVGDRTAVAGAISTLTFQFTDRNAADTHAASIDWGDGTPFIHLDSVGSSFTLRHAYEQTGVFQPRLWVTDSTNRTGIEDFTMTIYLNPNRQSQPPEIEALTNRSALSRTPVDFEFRFTDVNIDETFAAAVDWGDGTLTQLESVTSPFTTSHSFEEVGEYVPKVWVTDSNGRTDSAEFVMTVYPNPAPRLETPDRQAGFVLDTVSVDIMFSDSDPNDYYYIIVDWGDEEQTVEGGSMDCGCEGPLRPGVPIAITHTYFYPGTYTVNVIIGGGHRSDGTTFQVDVINHPAAPTLINGGVTVLKTPEEPPVNHPTVAIDLSFSEAAAGESHSLLVCSRELIPSEHFRIEDASSFHIGLGVCERREVPSEASFEFSYSLFRYFFGREVVYTREYRPQIWITDEGGRARFLQPFEIMFTEVERE